MAHRSGQIRGVLVRMVFRSQPNVPRTESAQTAVARKHRWTGPYLDCRSNARFKLPPFHQKNKSFTFLLHFKSGKFQMQVLARCGHVVHEDRPHEVAEVIASYMVRNKFAQPAGSFHRQMPSC